MVDIYMITERIRYLCNRSNGKFTGLDCSAVQLAGLAWYNHWLTFRNNFSNSNTIQIN